MQDSTREGRVDRDPLSCSRRVLRRPLKPATVRIMTGVMCLLVSGGKVATGDNAPAVGEQAQLTFLEQHWQVPIPPQGKPPARLSALEVSLDPESCAVCHRLQYDDWKGSLHSRSMGPGVIGQTLELTHDHPATAQLCYSCHAPLAEQQEKIHRRRGTRSRFQRNPGFLAPLQAKGLTCAGCHVRKHQHYGPPKRDGSLENSPSASQLPHGGAIRTPAFERAEFCKGCHQFEPDGYALNGKLLENTYNEWLEGPYGREGKACQSCHMPDRRHLWRGIHDPEMVKAGVTVDLQLSQANYKIGDKLEASLTLTNSGVGHYFPTYVTPKVVVRIELLDASGQVIADSVKEEIVGRQVTLNLDREIADTRIPPKGAHTFRYAGTIDRSGLRLHAEVVVYPDDFYRQFYEVKLAGKLSTIDRQRLSQALEDTRKAVYKLFEKDVAL